MASLRWLKQSLWLGMVLLVLAAGCIRAYRGNFWGQGRNLQVNVRELHTVPQLFSNLDGGYYQIAPQQPGNVLAVLKVTVVNPDATRVVLAIDEEAALLADTSGNQFRPINPSVQRQPVELDKPPRETFEGFLWGNLEVPKGYQVSGWMVFEVPKGSKLGGFRWDEADAVIVAF